MKSEGFLKHVYLNMQKYVIGFLFDKERENLILIQKTKPEWQRGNYNGVGGKVELGETYEQAMVREFEEETGIKDKINWQLFNLMDNADSKQFPYTIAIYRAFEDYEILAKAKSTTEEQIKIVAIQEFWDGSLPLIYNLQWIIPMALDGLINLASVTLQDN
jgi:8-oxo-dGTP diphosphatase